MGSPAVLGFPSRIHSISRITLSSISAPKSKLSSCSSPIDLIGGIKVPEGSVKSKVPIFKGAKADSAAMNKRLLLQKDSTLPHLLPGLDLKKIKKVTSHAMTVKDDLLPIVEVARRTLIMSGDSKFMSNLSDLVVMDKSIGLCYKVY